MNAKPIEGKGYDPNGRHVRPLAKQVGEAAFWNVLILPLQALLSLAYALLIRRWFGLFSGVLDVLIGLLKALNLYSDLGVLRGLPKFIPEINASTGPKRLLRFLGRVITIRLFVLIVFLAVLNVLAESIANRFALGANGITYLRLLSGLALASAVHDLIITTLNSFFGQLWSNVLSLVQGLCNLLFVVLVLSFGFEISGVLSALLLSTVIVACIASARAFWILKNNDENHSNKTTPAPAFPYLFETSEKDLKRFFHFTGTMYVIGLPSIFVTLSFASPTIGLVLNLEEVALFSTAFNLVLSSVTFVVGGFRGIYRPLLARLRIRADARQTQLAYLAITKAQLLLLIPGAFGLAVLCGEYIPLLFGNQFLGAVPVARILVFLLYAETAFNLPSMMLTIDEQYKAMAWRNSALVVFAPLFIVATYYQGVIGAAWSLGGIRVVHAFWSYLLCQRLFKVEFPWFFSAKIIGVSVIMAVVLNAIKEVWPVSILGVATLTAVGVVLYATGVRLTGILGDDEVNFLKRSELPGRSVLIKWLAPNYIN